MNKQNQTIDVIYNEEKTKIIGFVVDGKKYENKKNENTVDFFYRIQKKLSKKGVNFAERYSKGNNRAFTEKVYRQKVETIKKADKQLQNKIFKKRLVAGVTAMAIGLSGAIYGLTGCKAKEEKSNNQNTEKSNYQINEQNQELARIYNELLKYENGEEWVKRLQQIDDYQNKLNQKAEKYPDGKGNALFFKAEEVAAADAIANGTNKDIPTTLDSELVLCLYLQWAGFSSELVEASGKISEVETLIEDQNVKKSYTEVAEKVQEILDGKKVSDIKSLTNLYKYYPEAPSLTAYDGTMTTLAINGKITGKTLTKYQNEVKGNAVLNEVIQKIKAKQKLETKLNPKLSLAIEAFEEMDKQNIKVNYKEREDFDLSTTERIKKITSFKSQIVSNKDGSYTVVTKHGRVKLTKKQAIKRLGKKAVEKAIKEADARDIIVDTDGDGKKDSTLDEAEKISEQKKQEVENKAKEAENGFADGRKDGLAGSPKNYRSTNEYYIARYDVGYQNGLFQREEAQKEEIIETKTTYVTPSSTQNTTQTETTTKTETQTTQNTTQTETKPQVVKEVFRAEDGTLYESTFEEEIEKIRTK